MSTLRRNSLISLFSLFFQSGYSAVLGLIANVVLTIVVPTATFGIYITVLSMVSIGNYFADVGLAGALIQKKEVSDKDIHTVFYVQLTLISIVVSIGFLLTNTIRGFYALPQEGIYLYWAVLIGFFLSTLKTIPSVLLERKVRFDQIVKVQITESTLFYIIVTVGALAGLGLYSFTIAVLVRAIVGITFIYYLSPYKPRFVFDTHTLRELLMFGIPFQASSFLALFKDDILILYLSKTLGFEAIGYIGWAKKWADAPVRIISDNVSKVLFPMFSRLQEDSEKLKKTIILTLRAQTAVLVPVYIFAIIAMPYVVQIVPKYSKWEPAVIIFQILCVSALLSTFSTPFMNIFNALKMPKVPLVFMIIWTTLTWVLTIPFTQWYGPVGFAYVQLILSSTCVIVIWYAQRVLKVNIVKEIFNPKIRF